MELKDNQLYSRCQIKTPQLIKVGGFEIFLILDNNK
jgi:hypothetical protein